MTAIMIYHIRSKYTAVGESRFRHMQDLALYVCTGRKEIVMFFWLYAVIELLAIFLDSGIIPTANVSYPVSATILSNRQIHINLVSGSLLCTQDLSQQRIVVC